MFQGELIGIYIVECKGGDLHSVDQAEAVAGRGIAGDRYFVAQGTFSNKNGPDREVTLIEVEALEGLQREYDINLAPHHARRNLLTRNVPLNHLVGREFTVGSVVLRGLRLCEPCGYLEKQTVNGLQTGLRHRGGLRAQILRGGILQTGSAIRVVES